MDTHIDRLALAIDLLIDMRTFREVERTLTAIPDLRRTKQTAETLSAHVNRLYEKYALSLSGTPEIMYLRAVWKLYNDESLEEPLTKTRQGDSDVAHKVLSDREYQVLCLLGGGRGVYEAAEYLSLSPKTVSTYRARILDKMQLKNTAEIIHYAIVNKLVQ